ncbi:MAG TPA: hypothetical protein VK875_13840, partial [Euzebyales bacterium]|nr:hypothetical protein [Euzebyales bacterium]
MESVVSCREGSTDDDPIGDNVAVPDGEGTEDPLAEGAATAGPVMGDTAPATPASDVGTTGAGPPPAGPPRGPPPIGPTGGTEAVPPPLGGDPAIVGSARTTGASAAGAIDDRFTSEAGRLTEPSEVESAAADDGAVGGTEADGAV